MDSKFRLQWPNILVPIDFADPFNQALQIAIGMAERLQATLTLLNVVHLPACYPMDTLQDLEGLMSCASNSLENMCSIVPPSLVSQKLVRFAQEDVAEEIIKAAVELPASFMVISIHRHGGLARVLHPGIADKVIHHSPCPVLVVPLKKQDTGSIPLHAAEPANQFKKNAAS